MAGGKNAKNVEMTAHIERSAGAVVFCGSGRSRRYLLLHHARKGPAPKEYWSFPKGHIEKGETSEDAARREIAEESGLWDVKIIPGFRAGERYIYTWRGKKTLKFVVWFVARTREKKITLSREHIGGVWLPYADAYKKVFYPGTKRILKKADTFLNRIAKSKPRR